VLAAIVVRARQSDPMDDSERRAKANERARRWRQAHPDRFREIQKKNRAKNSHRWKKPDMTHRVAQQRDYRARNPLQVRKNVLARHHLTIEAYDKVLADQNGGCAICHATEPGKDRASFCVDHDHACCPGMWSCGRCVRGLLCVDCNVLLGRAHDSAAILRAAAEYLEGSCSLL